MVVMVVVMATIQAASVGIGLVGKEGKQASLAADFSITQFSHIGRLLLVHGRNSYKRSASLSQFVIHRGLIITTMQVATGTSTITTTTTTTTTKTTITTTTTTTTTQAIFSAVFYFSSVSLYQGFLMVGYATVYTMLPVFALVLDTDVTGRTDLGITLSLTLSLILILTLTQG